MTSINNLQADSINAGVYSLGEKPNGLTYGNWTAKWWQWFVSIPQDVNPAGDFTGKYCGQNQNGPVWFLTGTFGGTAERTCEIPAGKAILFPLLNTECSYLENPELKTESELLTCAKQAQDSGSITMSATVDGTQLKNLEKYRVESQLFDLAFPENNVFSVAPGKTKAVSDGFWVFLEPLPSGNHEIDHSGSVLDPSGANNFNTQAKYHLIVKEPTNSTVPK
jgi:hypothetical protein